MNTEIIGLSADKGMFLNRFCFEMTPVSSLKYLKLAVYNPFERRVNS